MGKKVFRKQRWKNFWWFWMDFFRSLAVFAQKFDEDKLNRMRVT